MIVFAHTLAFAVIAAASAIDKTPRPSCTATQTDNYDKLDTNPVFPLFADVGTYNALTYEASVVAEPNPGTSGLLPHSKSNVAAIAAPQDLLTFGAVTLTPYGIITAGPGVKYFDLHSFYFGCILDLENSELTDTTGCTISVSGYNYLDEEVPEETFAFAPTSSQNQNLLLATLSANYTSLINVTIAIAGAAANSALTILDINDLSHCNYS